MLNTLSKNLVNCSSSGIAVLLFLLNVLRPVASKILANDLYPACPFRCPFCQIVIMLADGRPNPSKNAFDALISSAVIDPFDSA